MYPVPLGAIVMWTGSEADIPSGGNYVMETLFKALPINIPQILTDKFIKGASRSYRTKIKSNRWKSFYFTYQ